MVPGVRGTWDWRRFDTGWQRFLISHILYYVSHSTGFGWIWIDLSVVTLAVSLFSSCQDVWLACRHDHSSRKLAVASWSWVLLQQSSFGGRGAGQQFVWSFTYPYHTPPGPSGLDFAWSLHDFSVWQYVVSSRLLSSQPILYIYMFWYPIASCLVSLHLISSHHISTNRVSSCLTSSHFISSYFISSYLISSHLMQSFLVMSHHVSLCLIVSHHVSSCLIIISSYICVYLMSSYLVSSHEITSLQSHPIASYYFSVSHHLVRH